MKRRSWTTCAFAFLLAPSALPGTVPDGAGSPPAVQVVPVSEGRRLLNTGTSFTDRGDYPAAESAFRQVLNGAGFSAAEQASALLGLARNYRKAGAPTKAAAIYEKFIKEFPDDDRLPDAILDLGRTYRSMGVNKLALNRFYSVINTTLKLPQKGFEHYQSLARTAEYEIAETYYENGDFELARRYFSRLQLLDLSANDRARASFMAAHSQILAGDLEGGSKSLHAFLENWPDDENVPEARYLLASTLRKLKRPQEALATVMELLRQEKRLDGSDPQTWNYWQRRTGNLLANDFFQAGDMMSALAIYKSMMNLGTGPDWQLPVLYQVALCQERLFDFKESSAGYSKIVAEVTAQPTPSPDMTELAQMSSWRLSHIEWLQSTDARLAGFVSVSSDPSTSHTEAPAGATPSASAP
jgi:TolA-binding protein